jgi:hypothetical protein
LEGLGVELREAEEPLRQDGLEPNVGGVAVEAEGITPYLVNYDGSLVEGEVEVRCLVAELFPEMAAEQGQNLGLGVLWPQKPVER